MKMVQGLFTFSLRFYFLFVAKLVFLLFFGLFFYLWMGRMEIVVVADVADEGGNRMMAKKKKE